MVAANITTGLAWCGGLEHDENGRGISSFSKYLGATMTYMAEFWGEKLWCDEFGSSSWFGNGGAKLEWRMVGSASGWSII